MGWFRLSIFNYNYNDFIFKQDYMQNVLREIKYGQYCINIIKRNVREGMKKFVSINISIFIINLVLYIYQVMLDNFNFRVRKCRVFLNQLNFLIF